MKATAETTPRALNLYSLIAALLFAATALISVLHWQVLDYGIMHGINAFAQRSFILDHGMGDLSLNMFSSLPIVAMVWYAWFSRDNVEVRAGILVGVVVSFFAGVLSRGLQLALPSHLRPLHDAGLHFRIPMGVYPEGLNHWSSFPSDHAAVFFGLATTVFLANRAAGWLAILLAVSMNVARVYLGFHYPSDVLGGAALGVLLVLVTFRLRFLRPVMAVAAVPPRYRGLIYAIFFYLSFGLVTLMHDFREVASGVAHHLRGHAAASSPATDSSD